MSLVWKPKTDKILAQIQEEEDKIGQLSQPFPPEPSVSQPINWGKFGGAGATQVGVDWGKFQTTSHTQTIDWGKFKGISAPKKVPWYEKPQEYYSRPVAAGIMLPIWAQLHPEDPGSQMYAQHIKETIGSEGIGGVPEFLKGFLPGGRARQAYDIAEMPKYARGAAEIGVELPIWLAMPGAAGLRGGSLALKGAGLAKGASAAEIAAGLAKPAVGKGAMAARAARATLKPLAVMEAAPVKLLRKLTKKRPITSLKVLGRIWDKSSSDDRVALSKLAGVEKGLGGGAWKTLGGEGQKAIASVFKQPYELVALSAKDPTVQPLVRKTIKFMNDMWAARRKTDILTTVEKGARVVKAEKEMNKVLKAGGTMDEAARAFKDKLKTPYPFEQFVSPDKIPTPVEIDKLQRIAHQIAPDRFERLTAIEAIADLFRTGVTRPLAPHKLKILQEIFGADFVNAVKPLSRNRKLWNLFLDIANFPRALLTSFDLSATLRQNLFELLAHPKQFPRMVSKQLKAVISEEAMVKNRAQYMAREGIKETDDILKSAGIRDGINEFVAPMPGTPGATMYQMQEEFMSRFAQKTWGVKHSSRGFIDATTNTFTNSISEYWKLYGKTNIAGKVDIVEFAKLVGNSIGRGSLGHLKFASPILNATMFAPRYTASLFKLPRFLFSPSPLVRREAAKRLARLMIFGINTLRLAQLAGAEVGVNPLSSDFGKIKIGKTRLDYWRGYAQLSRFVSQLATARRKSTSGKMYETTRQQVIERFFQSKFSPGMGLLWDLLVGKTYMGEEVIPANKVELLKRFRDRLAPLTIQDFVEALEEEGLPMAMGAGTAAAFGIGVQTYTNLGKYEPGGSFGKTGFGASDFGQEGFK